MISVNDPYNLVPELFECFEDFQKSNQADVDILPPGCSESFQPSPRLTVFIQPEPDMNWAPEAYAKQIAARSNNIFAVSGYSDLCDWNLKNWVLHFSNLTMTARVNPDTAAVDPGVKPFLATALLGGWMINRGLIVKQLEQAGLLNQCLVNYHDRLPMSESQRQDWKQYHPDSAFSYRSPQLDSLDHPVFLDVAFQDTVCYALRPIPLNTCQQIPGMKPYQHGWISQLIPRNIYNSAYLSIVAETECMPCPDAFFISEKIAKPLIVGHPFVVLGCQHYLRHLKKLGFKTFDRWIDETYDSIQDASQRARSLVQSVIEFSKKTQSEKVQCLEQMAWVTDHNRRLATSSQWAFTDLVDTIKQQLNSQKDESQ